MNAKDSLLTLVSIWRKEPRLSYIRIPTNDPRGNGAKKKKSPFGKHDRNNCQEYKLSLNTAFQKKGGREAEYLCSPKHPLQKGELQANLLNEH
jgi:hypothetical protein